MYESTVSGTRYCFNYSNVLVYDAMKYLDQKLKGVKLPFDTIVIDLADKSKALLHGKQLSVGLLRTTTKVSDLHTELDTIFEPYLK